MKKSWLLICLINFLIAALMGLLLRFTYLFPININYTFLLHAHSHTAMLGWAYMMVYSLFINYFIPSEKKKRYTLLFWITQATVVGMMVSFSLQGYALFSIAFSTLHIFCSYYFCYRVGKDHHIDSLVSRKFAKAALVFMLISTIGVWSLGIITKLGQKNSELFQSAIQFFLHFQLNGWFIFGVLSIFFIILHQAGIIINLKQSKLLYSLLILSVVCTFALPLGWYYPHPALFYINCFGSGLQLISLVLFLKIILPGIKTLSEKMAPSVKWLLFLSLFSLSIKILIQLAAALPEIAVASHTIRNFTIGFIHLAMLGVVNGFLFFFISISEFVKHNKFWKIGIILFYTGFILTELILFIQGLNHFFSHGSIPGYFNILFIASTLLPIGISLILIGIVKKDRKAISFFGL